MYKIMVMESSEIDREMICTVLRENIHNTFELFESINEAEAQLILKVQDIDLMIINASANNTFVRQIIRLAYKMHEDINVILISEKPEDEVARLANKFDVSQYLLMPFSADELVNVVLPLQQTVMEMQVKAVEEKKDIYIEQIIVSIHECQYKKSTQIAKEYIDFLYDAEDNGNIIQIRMLEFVLSVANLEVSQSSQCRESLKMCAERFKSRYDIQRNRYKAENIIDEMLDCIFADLEMRQYYYDDDLKKALNYIDRNIKKGISLDDVAEYVSMSSSYFSKFFKKETGTNFIKYVIDRKIEFAKDMLEKTNMPVINIACELSYNETNYFSKAFKKKVGMSPTEYRQAKKCTCNVGGGAS